MQNAHSTKLKRVTDLEKRDSKDILGRWVSSVPNDKPWHFRSIQNVLISALGDDRM